MTVQFCPSSFLAPWLYPLEGPEAQRRITVVLLQVQGILKTVPSFYSFSVSTGTKLS